MKNKCVKRLLTIILAATMIIGQSQIVFGGTGVTSGKYSNLVLFVQFADTPSNFMMNDSDVNEIVKNYDSSSSASVKSLHGYVDAVSYGQMDIQSYLPQYDKATNTIEPLVLSGNSGIYQSEYALEHESIELLKAKYNDLSKYNLDLDSDGTIDNVTFIFAGDETDRSGLLYPHKADYDGTTDTINGKRMGTVNVLNYGAIKYGEFNNKGVICHEYMHSLGYPDLYTETGSAMPVGYWDLMATSSNFMQYPLTYLRSAISGWLDTTEVNFKSENKQLTLSPASANNGKRSYILKSPLSSTEFFVIEYRQKGTDINTSMDYKIPGTGLIVYRVNTKAEKLSNHNGLPFGVYVFRDGETSVNGANSSNLYSTSFYSEESGRTSVGSTDLDATIDDGALVFSDGSNSGIKISNIGSAGSTIACNIEFADYEKYEIWNQITGTEDLSDYSNEVSMDIDSKGNIYVAYDDGNGNLNVSKYNGINWEKIDLPIKSYSMNGILRIYKDVPYVLMSDNSNSLDMCLYRYDSGKWDLLNKWKSQSTEQNSYIQTMAMDVGSDGIYIAYADGVFKNYALSLVKYDGSAFQTLSSEFDSGTYSSPDIAIDNGEVYLCVRNYNNNKPVVYRYSNDGVKKLTNLEEACESNCKIAVGDNKLYLLVDDVSGMTVYQYLSTDKWEQVGEQTLTKIQSSTSDIDILDGVPIVQLVHQEDSEHNNTQVFRFKNGNWVQEGNTIDAGLTNDAELAIFGNKVYISYISKSGDNSYAMVKTKDVFISKKDVPLDPNADPVLIDIDVKEPSKLSFNIGEKVDFSDMVVKGIYSNNEVKTLTTDDYAVTPCDASSLGEKEVTVSVEDLNYSFKVTVIDDNLTGITVTPPTKTSYYVGDNMDLDGLRVTGNYLDKSSRELDGDNYTITGFDTSSVGEKTVTVTCCDYSQTFKINVKAVELTGVTITPPTKQRYYVGDRTDLTGLKVVGKYNNGTSKVLTSGQYIVTGATTSSIGNKTVTVAYGGYKANFVISVYGISGVSNLSQYGASTSSIKLKWSKVSGASGYMIYRATSATGKYSYIKKITSGSIYTYTNSSLGSGKKYYYKVKAYRGSVTGGWSRTISAVTNSKVPTYYKGYARTRTSIKLSWRKVSGASGYEIYRKTSSKGTYKKIKTTTRTSYINYKLKRNHNYYYKVRAIKKGSTYTCRGSFTKTKRIKTKR